MKTILKAVGVALALVTTMAQARLPSWYPPGGFEHWGKIDEIRSEESVIIIGDMFYRYREGALVHSLSQKSDSFARVQKGATVGFLYDVSKNGEWIIREFWLLPNNYSQSDD